MIACSRARRRRTTSCSGVPGSQASGRVRPGAISAYSVPSSASVGVSRAITFPALAWATVSSSVAQRYTGRSQRPQRRVEGSSAWGQPVPEPRPRAGGRQRAIPDGGDHRAVLGAWARADGGLHGIPLVCSRPAVHPGGAGEPLQPNAIVQLPGRLDGRRSTSCRDAGPVSCNNWFDLLCRSGLPSAEICNASWGCSADSMAGSSVHEAVALAGAARLTQMQTRGSLRSWCCCEPLAKVPGSSG